MNRYTNLHVYFKKQIPQKTDPKNLPTHKSNDCTFPYYGVYPKIRKKDQRERP